MTVSRLSYHVHVCIDLLFFLHLPKALRLSLFRQATEWIPSYLVHHLLFTPRAWESVESLIARYWPNRIPVVYLRTCEARHER